MVPNVVRSISISRPLHDLGARPDSQSADEPGSDVRHPCFASLARLQAAPPVSASFGGGKQSRCRPRVRSLSPRGLLPSSLTLQLPFCFEVRALGDGLVSSAPE